MVLEVEDIEMILGSCLQSYAMQVSNALIDNAALPLLGLFLRMLVSR